MAQVVCAYWGGGRVRREAKQAERAASAAAAEEAASAEANEAAGTAKPANCLAVACDRVQARLEREEATRTAAEAADRARRRQRPVDAMQADGNEMPGPETRGTGLMAAAVVGVASEDDLELDDLEQELADAEQELEWDVSVLEHHPSETREATVVKLDVSDVRIRIKEIRQTIIFVLNRRSARRAAFAACACARVCVLCVRV